MVEMTRGDFDDIEVLEALVDLSGGDSLALVRVMRSTLGPDRWAELKAELAGEDGRTSATAVTQWFLDKMAEVGAKKS